MREMNDVNAKQVENYWNPMKLLNPDGTRFKYGLMVLNQPIKLARSHMLSLWENACLRIAVDGGTNQLFKFSEKESCLLPDFITGDLDSVEEDVLEFYAKKGVRILVTPDQSKTDFTKAAVHAIEHLSKTNTKIDGLVAVVQSAGRMDQIFANINTVFKMSEMNMPVYLLSSESLTWLLSPGFHKIDIPSDHIAKRLWCGLIPVGSRANSVTTTGLKWNLYDRTLEFGGCVSTSNTYTGEPFVTIQTDSSLLWTMGLLEGDDF